LTDTGKQNCTGKYIN